MEKTEDRSIYKIDYNNISRKDKYINHLQAKLNLIYKECSNFPDVYGADVFCLLDRIKDICG